MKVSNPLDRHLQPAADDQTIGLINVAFLLLVFFLLAGTLLPPEPWETEKLELTGDAQTRPVVDRLLVDKDGRIAWQGRIIAADDINTALFSAVKDILTVQIDARADAVNTIRLLRQLRRAGVKEVRLIGSERLAR